MVRLEKFDEHSPTLLQHLEDGCYILLRGIYERLGCMLSIQKSREFFKEFTQ